MRKLSYKYNDLVTYELFNEAALIDRLTIGWEILNSKDKPCEFILHQDLIVIFAWFPSI